jgi:hypothetical protein
VARKKVPLGKAIKVSADISAKDQETIKAQWRKDAPKGLERLLDASVPDRQAGSIAGKTN